MRIMFKRHAQFTLDDGKVLYYEPDREYNDVPDELEKNFLFEHLSRSGGLVRIKDTAPAKKDDEPEHPADDSGMAGTDDGGEAAGDKQPENKPEPATQAETPKAEEPPAAPAKKPAKGKR